MTERRIYVKLLKSGKAPERCFPCPTNLKRIYAMLFNSYVFVLAFLPCVLAGWFLINRMGVPKAAKAFLIAASLYFYGYFNKWYLLIIVSSVLINYAMSRVILNPRRSYQKYRKAAFVFSAVANLGSLFVFKYFDFFIGNVNALFRTSLPLLHIALPLGISFFTFQQLSYIIDSYNGDENIKSYDFLDYALFVTYFPQLIAGPIVTHDEMIPQFADQSKKLFNADNFASGIYGFSLGLAKKVLIADVFGLVADRGFENVSALGSLNAALVMLAYTFQIYFDFSGYSDMAMGIGKMMNIDIAVNFNSPYQAVGITDFWKRWHITLTRFFTRYIYIPLGGNRRGAARTYLNIMIVYLVSGVWHGANWTFILWGVLHGVGSVATRVIEKKTGLFSSPPNKYVKGLLLAATFIFINLSWVLFRAGSVGEAMEFYAGLFSFRSVGIDKEMLGLISYDILEIAGQLLPFLSRAVSLTPLALYLFALAVCLFAKNTPQRIREFKPTFGKAALTAALLTLCVMSFAGVSSFLYWNF